MLPSRLEKAALDLVMWLEAPESRTHRFGSLLPASSKAASTLFSRRWTSMVVELAGEGDEA
jgi:hypothetical protein